MPSSNFFIRLVQCLDAYLMCLFFRVFFIIFCAYQLMWYSPRCSLWSHYLIHSENNSYFVGIGPTCDVVLTCIFRPSFSFVYFIEDRSQYYNINFQYTSVFKCCYHFIELYFVPYFGAEFETMLILKVYIYLPCINTQRRATVLFDNTPFISSRDHQKTGLYQVSANCCEGDCNSDLIRLLQKSQSTHYCNQSVLEIVLDLNILVYSIMIVDIISRSALVQFVLLHASYLYNQTGLGYYVYMILNLLSYGELSIYVLLLRSFISPKYNIKDNKVYYQLILYIKCVSIVQQHVVSAHGSATDINREYLGIVLFIFFYINFMYSCL